MCPDIHFFHTFRTGKKEKKASHAPKEGVWGGGGRETFLFKSWVPEIQSRSSSKPIALIALLLLSFQMA